MYRPVISRGPIGGSLEELGGVGRRGRSGGPIGIGDEWEDLINSSEWRCQFGLSVAEEAALWSECAELNTLKTNIVSIANRQWDRWNSGGTRRTERSRLMRDVMIDYWWTGVRMRVSASDVASAAWQNQWPWSAAFISWVMRQAGTGTRFRYAASHSRYTVWAKQNRLTASDNPFKAYRVTEAAAEVGDLVCKSRAGSGATYDNIRVGMTTHCDIVTEIQADRLVTVGGNVSNSVSKTYPSIDPATGKVTQSGYFAVIKIEENPLCQTLDAAPRTGASNGPSLPGRSGPTESSPSPGRK